ncbi:hypothetical protein LXL04_010201 [Taraxacum kok-saghyz]
MEVMVSGFAISFFPLGLKNSIRLSNNNFPNLPSDSGFMREAIKPQNENLLNFERSLELAYRGINIPDKRCRLCVTEEEDSNHLLVGCSFAKEILTWIFQWCNITTTYFDTVSELVNFAAN